MDWNYEYLGRCQYPVYHSSSAMEEDCGEPAIARIIWDESIWNVCQEHLDFMLQCEKEGEQWDTS